MRYLKTQRILLLPKKYGYSKQSTCIMQLWKPNTSQDILEAESWTPALLGLLAVSKTKTLCWAIRRDVADILGRNGLTPNQLLSSFLRASWEITFTYEDVVNFFYDQCDFGQKEEAITYALVLLWMRMHLENPGEKGSIMSSEGQNKVKDITWFSNRRMATKIAA